MGNADNATVLFARSYTLAALVAGEIATALVWHAASAVADAAKVVQTAARPRG
jgi:hypothetical protein